MLRHWNPSTNTSSTSNTEERKGHRKAEREDSTCHRLEQWHLPLRGLTHRYNIMFTPTQNPTPQDQRVSCMLHTAVLSREPPAWLPQSLQGPCKLRAGLRQVSHTQAGLVLSSVIQGSKVSWASITCGPWSPRRVVTGDGRSFTPQL